MKKIILSVCFSLSMILSLIPVSAETLEGDQAGEDYPVEVAEEEQEVTDEGNLEDKDDPVIEIQDDPEAISEENENTEPEDTPEVTEGNEEEPGNTADIQEPEDEEIPEVISETQEDEPEPVEDIPQEPFEKEEESVEVMAARTGVCGDSVTWSFENGVLTISGTGDMYNYHTETHYDWGDEFYPTYKGLNIVSVIVEPGVTSIGNLAFFQCGTIQSISLPDTLVTIGQSAFNQSSLESIVIPDSVTSISRMAFYLCADLESVELPSGLTSIVSEVFTGCTSLSTITIPDTVTAIGSQAFKNCSALTEVSIPDGVTEIYSSAFSGCTSLTEIIIPDSVTSIGDYAFSGCSGATKLVVPASVTSLGNNPFNNCSGLTTAGPAGDGNEYDYTYGWTETIPGGAFSGCTGLTDIALPEGMTSIPYSMFKNCASLESLTIPGTVTEIGSSAFYGCTNLKNVIIQDGVTKLGYEAFKNCTSLESIVIPGSIMEIPGNCFEGCTSLASVTILDGVKTIGTNAFKNCAALNKIVVPGSVERFSTSGYNGPAFTGCTKLTTAGPAGDGNEYDYTFGWTETIPGYAFADCSGLTDVRIPDGVTRVNMDVFMNCKELSHLVVPGTVTYFDYYALQGCTKLTTAGPIGDGNTYHYEFGWTEAIPEGAFGNNEYLTEVTLPDTITSIGDYAFWKCSALTGIDLPESLTSIGNCAFRDCSALTDVILPAGLTFIDQNAFWNCTALESISIPGSVHELQGYTFRDCTSLAQVEIGEGITAIGYNEFSGCTSLTEIVIPEGVTTLGNYAFSNCTSLQTITLPSSLGTIGESAFYQCNNLTDVYYGGPESKKDRNISSQSWKQGGNTALFNATWHCSEGTPGWDYCGDQVMWNYNEETDTLTITGTGTMWRFYYQINYRYYEEPLPWAEYTDTIQHVIIEDGVTSIGDGAFRNCSALEDIVIPDSISSIGQFAFYGCSKLASIRIPETVPGIAYSTFDSCTSLTSIVIPASVQNIDNYAFSNCTSLSRIDFLGDAPYMSIYSSYHFGGVNADVYYPISANWTYEDRRYGRGGTLRWHTYGSGSLNENISWTIENDILTITGTGPMPDYEQGEGPWYDAASLIKGIVIEPGITTIGAGVFEEFNKAKTISIPDGITSIGDWALSECYGLEEIIIPDTVTVIGEGAFNYCSSVKSLDLPEGLTSIGATAFNGCQELESIVIPDGITEIPDNAFRGCHSLQNVVIPDSVTYIGEDVFDYCHSLKSIHLPDGITSLPTYLFVGCENLENVNIPANVTYIGEYTFAGCEKLQNVTLPEGLTKIDNYAFAGCHSFTEIVIPDSVTELGEYVFGDCKNVTSLTLPNNVPVPDYGFTGCSGLTEIVIPEGVTGIGAHGFEGCTGVTSVTIPDSVTYIGEDAFNGCTSLQYVMVNDMSHTPQAVLDYPWPEGVMILSNSGKISDDVGWTLTDGTLRITGTGPIPDYEEGGAPWANCTSLIKNVVIDPGITSLGDHLFEGCADMTSVTIPEGVTSIGDHTFEGCQSLTAVTLPDSLTSIGAYGFAGCTGLTSIVIPANVTYIGEHAFEGCVNLIYILLPEGIEQIGEGAFDGCDNLQFVLVPDGENIPDVVDDYPWPEGVDVAGGIDVPEELIYTRLLSGKKLQLSAETVVGKLYWSISPVERQYATVSSTGLVTAKNVTEEHTITVTAATLDKVISQDFYVTVYPLAQKVVAVDENGKNVSKKTVDYDLRSGLESMTFHAYVLPDDAGQGITWKLTDKKKISEMTVNEDGSVTIRSRNDKTGTVTLTATAKEGKKKKTTIKVRFTRFAQPADNLAVTNAPETMTGGTSLTFKTNIKGIALLTNRTLVWSFDPDVVRNSTMYATITAGGKLATSSVAEPTSITVYIWAKANPSAKTEVHITLMPKEDVSGLIEQIDLLRNGEVINNTVQVLDLGTEGTQLEITGRSIPEGMLTWKSSNTKIASVDAAGVITAKKAGTVTITATAADGSKVKASFKLNIRQSVQGIGIAEEDVSLRGGTKKTLHAVFYPEKPTNRKVTWSLRPQDNPYATISKKGVLKAKKVTGIHHVKVTVTSAEDSSISYTMTVTVYPSVSSVQLLYEDEIVTKKTITVSLAEAQEGIRLESMLYPTGSKEEVTWKSSNKKVAEVSADGVVTAKKKGKIKITARAADGSKKSSYVTIKIVP